MKYSMREMSPREISALQVGKTMDSVLPITFPSGFVLTGFTAHCAQCAREFEGSELRADHQWLNGSTLSIVAVANCSECDVVTVTNRRIKSDEGGTRVEFYQQNGEWASVPFVDKKKKKGVLAWLKAIWKK